MNRIQDIHCLFFVYPVFLVFQHSSDSVKSVTAKSVRIVNSAGKPEIRGYKSARFTGPEHGCLAVDIFDNRGFSRCIGYLIMIGAGAAEQIVHVIAFEYFYSLFNCRGVVKNGAYDSGRCDIFPFRLCESLRSFKLKNTNGKPLFIHPVNGNVWRDKSEQ